MTSGIFLVILYNIMSKREQEKLLTYLEWKVEELMSERRSKPPSPLYDNHKYNIHDHEDYGPNKYVLKTGDVEQDKKIIVVCQDT